MSRRLPVYVVLDVSGSMNGEPIAAVQQGLDLLVSTLKRDPHALETVHLSIITFDETAQELVPLTELATITSPRLEVGSTTSLGAALLKTKDCIERDVRKNSDTTEADWKPLVFLLTDGVPTDNWSKGAAEFKKVRVGAFVACAAGPAADTSVLKQITSDVVLLDKAGPSEIAQYFKWITQSTSTASQKVDLQKREPAGLSELPPPPPIIKLV